MAAPRFSPTLPGGAASLASAKPGVPARALLDLGLTCAAMGEDGDAIDALREATRLALASREVWLLLAALLRRSGEEAEAAAAEAAAALAVNTAPRPARPMAPAKLEAAERRLREQARASAAVDFETVLRGRLREAPADAAALRLLGEAALNDGRLALAEAVLARALDLAPLYVQARHLYAVALFRTHREAEAVPQIERVLAQDPRNAAYRTLLASCLAMTGEMERAIDLYAAVLRDAPKLHAVRLSHAQALTHAGRKGEAEQALRTALALDPSSGSAWWLLADLGGLRPAQADLDAMRVQLRAPGQSAESLSQLQYALGRALEGAGDYETSFAHYAEGARLWRRQIAYDPAATSARVRRAKAFFTRDTMAALEGVGCAGPAPIFVLGMPRAGSTLVEQILASHSQVEGTQELPDIGRLVGELEAARPGGLGYPECLAYMTKAELAALGARYLERTQAYRRQGVPFFIDKMPANWADTGFIHLILPHTVIIDVRREPMANCFGAFKKFFPVGQAFTYDLGELGRYYTDYALLMAHMDDAMPGRIHRVVYEDLVADTETQIRRLLACCGLAFEPACLRFWATERSVSTVSASQVRQPIFRDGLDQWRHYEPWLGTLRQALSLRE